MEAEKLITVSLGKIASSRCQRGGVNLHKNLLVASVLHKARTVYMLDAYQHIISNRKQKQEVDSCCVDQSKPVEKCSVSDEQTSACQAGSRSAMTHAADISHAENSNGLSQPSAHDDNKGSVVSQGVDITNTSTENNTVLTEVNTNGVNECNTTQSTMSVCEKAESVSEKNDSALKESTMAYTNSRTCAGTVSPSKRRRSCNVDSQQNSNDSQDSPKKAKFDIPSVEDRLSADKENVENASDCLRGNKEDSSRVSCDVTKSCEKSEPMQTDTTQITALVTIFNTGFNGLCSMNSNTESNLNSQTLCCATELKHESVQIPSGIALTV